MGIKQVYNRVLDRELNAHAAWPPIANTFALGDYGIFDGGVFQRLGNISEFGVQVQSKVSPQAALKFSSEGTTIVRTAGGLEGLEAFPPAGIDGELKFEFSSANSLVVRASAIQLAEMQNVAEVANALKRKKPWRWRYKVVRQLWRAEAPVILAARESGTSVALSGDVGLLEQVELGSVAGQLEVRSTGNVALEFVGRSGIVGLGLFRVKLVGMPAGLLGPKGGTDPEIEIEDINSSADGPQDDI